MTDTNKKKLDKYRPTLTIKELREELNSLDSRYDNIPIFHRTGEITFERNEGNCNFFVSYGICVKSGRYKDGEVTKDMFFLLY